jgi:hypothetical protein
VRTPHRGPQVFALQEIAIKASPPVDLPPARPDGEWRDAFLARQRVRSLLLADAHVFCCFQSLGMGACTMDSEPSLALPDLLFICQSAVVVVLELFAGIIG